MANKRRYHPLVADDLSAAVDYYGILSDDLANSFRSSIQDCFQTIGQRPQSFACINKQIRAAMTDKFPYVVLFEFQEETVTVLGVFHAASDNRGWFKRSL